MMRIRILSNHSFALLLQPTILPILLSLSVFVPAAAAAARVPAGTEALRSHRVSAVPGEHLILSRNRGMAKTAGDTFAVYGGPGTDEGHFETNGVPDAQGWTGLDVTEFPNHWHVSTFNAEILDPSVTPNHALWCGAENMLLEGWANDTGYGNSWDDGLEFLWTVPDPAQSHEVHLEFTFNHDSEPGYDYFHVELDSAGIKQTLAAYSGRNNQGYDWFIPPVTPVIFDQIFTVDPGSYVGEFFDQIRLVLRFTSDGAWSPQDGLWPSVLGAVQVDRIRVSIDGNEVSFADFEGSPGDDDWQRVIEPFVGDFFRIWPRTIDLDPCHDNESAAISFMDDGSPPNNASGQSTGGSYSPVWSPIYASEGGMPELTMGVPVVSYTGGLTQGLESLNDSAISPWIEWDDPSTTADDDLDSGAFLRFDLYDHMPLENGIFWNWGVTSDDVGYYGGQFGIWQDRGFVYQGSSIPRWRTVQAEVRDLLGQNPTIVRIRLQVIDLAELFGLPGGDATPSPYFDNVSLWRYQHVGPRIQVRDFELFRDTFPAGDTLDPSGSLADLACRIDPSTSLRSDSSLAGDSLAVRVTSLVDGVTLDGPPRLQWALEANPFFDAVRQLPAGAVQAGTNARGWPVWTGEVLGQPTTTWYGTPVEDGFDFDLPDGPARAGAGWDTAEPAMFYPGDLLRFAIIAEDTGGGMSHLPDDLTGLVSGVNWDRRFEARALPGLDESGAQPEILLWQDGLQRRNFADGSEAVPWDVNQLPESIQALAENGLELGIDFDLFRSYPWNDHLDGLGAADRSGATVDQIAGYHTLIYAGDDRSPLLGAGVFPAEADDVGLIRSWRQLPGPRNAAWFADRLASSAYVLFASLGQRSFVEDDLQLVIESGDVSEYVSGQVSPLVRPTDFVPIGPRPQLESFLAFGGCPDVRVLDAVSAGASGLVTHRFLERDGSEVMDIAAGVLHERVVGGDLKRDWSFPFDLSVASEVRSKTAGARTARAELVKDVLELFGTTTGGPVAAPTPARFTVGKPHPNPFNPRTEISLVVPTTGELRASVYDLRGRLVRTLHDGTVDRGRLTLVWDGRDEDQGRVASGVYAYVVEGFGRTVRGKFALIK